MINEEELKKLQEEKDAAWEAYAKVRDKIDDLKVEQLTEKYKGKYIKYSDCNELDRCEEPIYMFITNIWQSHQEDHIYFEGDCMSSYFCEFDDCTYFNWTPWTQNRLTAHDVIREDWQDEHIKIITEEEYKEVFETAVEQMKKRFYDDFNENEDVVATDGEQKKESIAECYQCHEAFKFTEEQVIDDSYVVCPCCGEQICLLD